MTQIDPRCTRTPTSARESRNRAGFSALRAAAVLVAILAVTSSAQQRATPLPSPESVIGFAPGADYKLFTYDQSIDYFKRLAAATNRMKLITVGKTAYGKTWTA